MCTFILWWELDLLIEGTVLGPVVFGVFISGLNGKDAIKLEEAVNNSKDGIRIRERKQKTGKLAPEKYMRKRTMGVTGQVG